MRIAIDALGLPVYGGARVSALGWLRALASHDGKNRYLVFLSHPEASLYQFSNIEQRVAPFENRFTVRFWAQLQLPRLVRKEGADLLHGMKNLSAFGVGCPAIVTINDLSHVILSDLYPWIDGLYWRWVHPQILKRADHIIAISDNTKHDLMQFYGLDAARVVTIYPSCDERFRQPPEADDLDRVSAKYRLPGSLLLYVGGLGVHKNVITLVRAFARIANQIPHGLVLVGGAHHTTSDQSLANEVTALGLKERVWMLGSVPAEDLPPLYHLADLFLLASLNEGFGLVVLEAMACGTPVLAASTGGVKEVIGDCGWLLDDPLDVEGFAEATIALLAHPRRRARMSADGLERSKVFTWGRTAELTLALYREVAGGQR